MYTTYATHDTRISFARYWPNEYEYVENVEYYSEAIILSAGCVVRVSVSERECKMRMA